MSRKTGSVKSQKTILIVVEGHTEKIYFSQMKSFERIQGVTIVPRLAKHSPVITVIDTAIKESRAYVYDSIWCVFDRDTVAADGITKELKAKINEAAALGIKFADSLPSFEIWFLLHFVLPKRYYSGQDALIKELRSHINNYEKSAEWLINKNLYVALRGLLKTAKDNGKILARRNAETNEKDVSMCNVYKLFDELITN